MTIAKQLRKDIAQQAIKSDDNVDFYITASLGVYTLTHEERARIQNEYKALALEENTQALAEPRKNRKQLDRRQGERRQGERRQGERRQERGSHSSNQAGAQQTHAQKRISHRRKRAAKEIVQAQLPSDICQRLICIADKALYEAKDRGRNQVVSANHMLAVEKDKIAVLYATS